MVKKGNEVLVQLCVTWAHLGKRLLLGKTQMCFVAGFHPPQSEKELLRKERAMSHMSIRQFR
jgi:hypothetical protein